MAVPEPGLYGYLYGSGQSICIRCRNKSYAVFSSVLIVGRLLFVYLYVECVIFFLGCSVSGTQTDVHHYPNGQGEVEYLQLYLYPDCRFHDLVGGIWFKCPLAWRSGKVRAGVGQGYRNAGYDGRRGADAANDRASLWNDRQL